MCGGELHRLDVQVVTLQLPSEILRGNHPAGETAEGIFICDVESRGIVYCRPLTGGIQG